MVTDTLQEDPRHSKRRMLLIFVPSELGPSCLGKQTRRKWRIRRGGGSLCGYSLNSTSGRIYHPVTKHVVKRPNVVSIQTPPNVLPPAHHAYDNGYVTEDDLVRDIRHHIARLNHDSGATSHEILANEHRRAFELLEGLDYITTCIEESAGFTPPGGGAAGCCQLCL